MYYTFRSLSQVIYLRGKQFGTTSFMLACCKDQIDIAKWLFSSFTIDLEHRNSVRAGTLKYCWH